MEREDYFLQLDCHSRFYTGWDEILIEELQSALALNERAVISHYPINIKNMTSEQHAPLIGHVNRYRQVDADAIKSHGSLVTLPEVPIVSFGISAAMLFMRGDDRRRSLIPSSILVCMRKSRFCTQFGYGPMATIFLSHKTRRCNRLRGFSDRIPDEAKRISNSNRTGWPKASWSKAKYLLGLDSFEQVDPVYQDSMTECSEKFGMGHERSLLDYYRFAGIHEELKEAFPNYFFQDH